MTLFFDHEDIWQYLSREKRPVVIYGMGNGADKLFETCDLYQIKIAGVLASLEFVRKKVFRGFPVGSIDDAETLFPNLPVLLAFGSDREEVLNRFYMLDKICEFYAPDLPLYGGGLFNVEYANRHKDEILNAFSILADEKSKEVFQNILHYKLTGKLSFLKAAQSSRLEAFSLLKINESEKYVDIGAYNGDTIRELLSTAGGYDEITAIEPDSRNFKKLSAYCGDAGLERVTLINKGVWNEKTTVCFSDMSGRNSAFNDTGKQIEADSADHLLNGRAVTLIKIDAEGAERQVLEGCRETIEKYEPKLMVSAYHRNEDLFALILQLHEINPQYHIFLRHHPYVPAWETNLYIK